MAINIASFNLYTFSSNEDRINVKSFDKIARIIGESNADIVALQEVFDQQSIDSLMTQLRGFGGVRRNWMSYFDRKKTHRNNREGYAFLWDESVVSLACDDYGEKIEPTIMTRYTSLKRPPMVGRFRTVNGMKYEVCVINTHIIFNKDKYMKAQEHPEWFSSGAMRALEYSKMVREIYPVFADHSNVYAVIAGDYNLTGKMLLAINALGNQKGDRPKMISVQDAKTTIRVIDKAEKPTGGQDRNEVQSHGIIWGVFNSVISLFCRNQKIHGSLLAQDESKIAQDASLLDGDYANDYDHFSCELTRVAPYVKNPRRIDVPESLFPLPQHRFHDYKADVSDHVPVVATLDLSTSLI